ncbi:MAG: site-specific integrase [Actinomycetota bacterium]|nr:site-specific integrase [Actinomycetota bacterium]
MTYIVQRKDRFYVVAYDGLDPLTGKERRRWHPVGRDRAEAEAIAAQVDSQRVPAPPARGGPTTLGEFLATTWLPAKRRDVRATTAYRYAWFVERYVNPVIGDIPLRRLRADHLDAFYESLAATGGRHGDGLAPKTVLEVHMIVRAALDQAVERELVGRNVAHGSRARRRPPTRAAARTWNPGELRVFLGAARGHRLYVALHLAAHTGMRRGEIVGLKWSDLDRPTSRLSISRTLQNVGGRPVEFGVKTRTSRRTVDLDEHTLRELDRWRRRVRDEGLPYGPDDWMFCNIAGRLLNPESVSQLFDRIVRRTELSRIRFHDLRHTHASLLVAAGVPIKVVSERLGHAHPAFTMHTYQHLLPGMSAAAAEQFAALVGTSSR